jgi:hypothetical protein
MMELQLLSVPFAMLMLELVLVKLVFTTLV